MKPQITRAWTRLQSRLSFPFGRFLMISLPFGAELQTPTVVNGPRLPALPERLYSVWNPTLKERYGYVSTFGRIYPNCSTNFPLTRSCWNTSLPGGRLCEFFFVVDSGFVLSYEGGLLSLRYIHLPIGELIPGIPAPPNSINSKTSLIQRVLIS